MRIIVYVCMPDNLRRERAPSTLHRDGRRRINQRSGNDHIVLTLHFV